MYACNHCCHHLPVVPDESQAVSLPLRCRDGAPTGCAADPDRAAGNLELRSRTATSRHCAVSLSLQRYYARVASAPTACSPGGGDAPCQIERFFSGGIVSEPDEGTLGLCG